MAKISPIAILGHVAHDLVRHNRDDAPLHALGGAAAFAARAALALGYRVELVTAAPVDMPLLEGLRTAPDLSLHLKACDEPTTFELDYTGDGRKIHLRSRAPTLTAADVPNVARTAPLVYLGPVIGECGRDVVDALDGSRVVVGAQGWLRQANEQGLLVPHALDEALEPPSVRAAVFSELDHPDADSIAERMANRCSVVALTRGARGVTLFVDGSKQELSTTPVDDVDPTGAGDVFGLVLGIELQRGVSPARAAQVAMRAAASVVQGPGLGRLLEVRDSLRA